MDGDPTLFATEAAVKASWRVVDPVLQNKTPLIAYQPGTWGPVEADALVARWGGWSYPVEH